MTPTWTNKPSIPGVYIVRHYWTDGTQSGVDYLYRLAGLNGNGEPYWVTMIGQPDGRMINWDEHERMRFFGPIPAMPIDLIPTQGESE